MLSEKSIKDLGHNGQNYCDSMNIQNILVEYVAVNSVDQYQTA